MSLGGVSVGKPTQQRLDAMLRSSRAAAPSYDFVGATLNPDDRTCDEHTLVVGHGGHDLGAAREALLSWVPQRSIGATVLPPGQRVDKGATVFLVIRRGPAYVIARNRVVDVVDQPRHFAYAYGTLSGHPERGEESFALDLLQDDTLRMTIRVRAEPATRVGRAVSPIVKYLQTAALRRYLAAVDDHVRGGSPNNGS